ncbi:MAG TPA: replication protein RepA [Terriglobia bacterium]|nr:replication protein RepA [Terriglobia bacterium]
MTLASPHVDLDAPVERCENTQYNRVNLFAGQFPQTSHNCQPQAGGFATIGSLLPHLGITKRTLKKLEAIQFVRNKRESHRQEIGYNARPFVLCGLPLRQPPKNQLIYTRRNGNLRLEITAHPRFGLPYGQDRLIPIWLATLAPHQKSRTLHFDSPSQLLDYFRLRKDGSQYRRMKGAFQRLFAATIFFGSEDQPKKRLIVDWTRFHFLDEMQLWFNRQDQMQPPAQETPCNVVVLSDAFYRELVGHPIPVERDVVAALAHVPLFGPNGLTNQLGTKQYSVERLFRHKITQWLRHVKQLWPECPAFISDDGLFLVISSSRHSAPIKPVERAVNS